ncbi:MAG: NADH-quinone oxidoreductase subunit L [Dehalococcoidia bacterium]|nr:NADH-quinone oxidoreductase subunit L [Bacillota bacterium]
MTDATISYLPVIAVLSPMLLSIVVCYVGGKSEKASDVLSIATCVGAFLAGMAKRMPITMLTFSIAALSMMGIPLLCGFISKWTLAMGALETGEPVFMVSILLLILSGIMNAIYFVPIIIKAYFGANEYEGGYDDAPPSMLVPMVILAAGCIVFGIFTNLSFSAIIPAARALLGG